MKLFSFTSYSLKYFQIQMSFEWTSSSLPSSQYLLDGRPELGLTFTVVVTYPSVCQQPNLPRVNICIVSCHLHSFTHLSSGEILLQTKYSLNLKCKISVSIMKVLFCLQRAVKIKAVLVILQNYRTTCINTNHLYNQAYGRHLCI